MNLPPLQCLAGLRLKGRGIHLPARDGDKPGRGRQLPVGISVEQGWKDLAAGQVAGGAEDDERERLDRNNATCHEPSTTMRPPVWRRRAIDPGGPSKRHPSGLIVTGVQGAGDLFPSSGR